MSKSKHEHKKEDKPSGNKPKKKGKKPEIPLDQLVLKALGSSPKHFSIKQIAKQLKGELSREDIYQALNQLQQRGLVSKSEHNRYFLKQQPERRQPQQAKKQRSFEQAEITGIVDMTMSGTAFIITDELETDIFVSQRDTKSALDGDKVRVRIYERGKEGRIKGEIIEIIERAQEHFIGVLRVSESYAFLVADKRNMPMDIFIPLRNLKGAEHGQKVLVKVIDWEGKGKNPVGEVEEILGFPGNNDVEMKSILLEAGFRLHFPDKVIKELNKIPEKIPAEEIAKRRDFRNTTTFTIDPIDAKDFDDAISISKLDNGHWEIGVHIADVSHYVEPKSALDKEAYERATSVYLVDRVAPMFPEKLSNIICSLRPQEEKLCFAAVFEMDEEGTIFSEWFGKTIIFSDKRFTYEEAQEVLEGAPGPYPNELRILNTIAKKLRAERFRQGAIGFEKAEIKFKLAPDGTPIGVVVKERKDAHLLIEDYMLLANKKVAEFMAAQNKGKRERPFVYRIHGKPDQEKIGAFARFASKFGYTINTSDPKLIAPSMNKLLSDVRGKAEQNVLEHLAIRTMAKAVYSTKNVGHYGLAFEHYTHFTSPIRRYPDVMAHRLLEEVLKGENKRHKQEALEEKCVHSSMMERKAEEAERTSVKYKQVEYMKKHVGDVFEGLVSGVSEYGLYIEVIENKCEGFVRKDTMTDDIYTFDEANYCMAGINKGKRYQLGDMVNIQVIRADMEKRQLDYELVDSI